MQVFKHQSARVLRWAKRVSELFPLTLVGVSVVIAAVYALRSWAHARLDLVVLVIGYTALALVALGCLTVALTSMALAYRLRFPPTTTRPLLLETQTSQSTGYILTSLRWMPLVHLTWRWHWPMGCEVTQTPQKGNYAEHVRALERGEYEQVDRRIVVEDVLGLCRITLRQREQRPVYVSPATGGLRNSAVLTAYAGGEDLAHPFGLPHGDRVELRRYQAGDPARFIHWKLYARTRKLMTRSHETAISTTHRVLAYMISGPEDDASAAAARVALEQGGLGDEWLFGADGSLEVADQVDRALHLLRISKQAPAQGPTQLPGFVERYGRSEPASILIFAPAVMRSDWVAAVMQVSAHHYGSVRVLIGVDTLDYGRQPGRLRRMLFYPQGDARWDRTAVDALARRLRGAGVEVVLLERHTGRVFSGEHLRQPASRGVVTYA